MSSTGEEQAGTRAPRFGVTRSGDAVHARTADHHPAGTRSQRLNKAVAVRVTSGVGTMWCAYAFAALALVSLPAAILTGNVIVIISWIAQTFFQLVLLSVILVGQNIQSAAADARAAKTFEDVEDVRASLGQALDLLDTRTRGGLREVLDAIGLLPEQLAGRTG